VVDRARAGTYTQFEVQRGLGITQMIRWFAECEDGWRAAEALRRTVRFQVHNILETPPHPGQFDIILCRNVLLYLSPEKRALAFDRLASALAPDGALMLGAGETVIGQTERFAADRETRGLYRLADAASADRRDSRVA
jgi:chemotaxis protein methyltransferase CheR